MHELLTGQILTTPIPLGAATGLGVFGLVAGATLALMTVTDKLEKARKLMKIAIRYESEADRTYAKICALTEPTQQVAIIDLFPPTRVQSIRKAVAAAFERATWRNERATEHTPGWADGELRRVIDETAEEPVPATPYAAPPVAEPAPIPTETPAPVYRTRRDPSERVPARERWAPRMVQLLGGPIPVPALFASIQVPAQRRVPSPLVMARLPEDVTRQYRVKVRAA